MKKNVFFCLFLFISAFSVSAVAQQKGSFSVTLQFAGESRLLSCYVPSDYNSENAYKLIVGLHGAGDNSVNYRDALINYLKWQDASPNTIFAFPDGGSDEAKDFLAPEGDELFIDEAIEYMKENYNIDESNIILQGFSLGGRSAAVIGLRSPEKYKGLLLNTPAIQGYYDFHNTELFNYSNASKVPIVVLWGDADFAYRLVCDSLLRRLMENDCEAAGLGVGNMGHTLPPTQIMSIAFSFFDMPLADLADAEAIRFDAEKFSCDGSIHPTIFFRNYSDEPLQNATFTLYDQDNDFIGTYEWAGEAKAFKFTGFNLGEVQFDKSGSQKLYLYVTKINDEELAPRLFDSLTCFVYQGHGEPLPFLEIFEDYDAFLENWEVVPSGNNFTWMHSYTFYDTDDNYMMMFNTIALFNNMGVAEEMISPPLDLTSVDVPTLSFDAAFSYHRWGPPYFEQSFTVTDTLEILISGDCGNTFTTILKKYGDGLLTLPSPLFNPYPIEEGLFDPEGHWKTFEVDLSQYADLQNARFKVRYISGYGGTVMLNNFAVANKQSSGVEGNNAEISVFPNPAADFVNIISEQPIDEINVFDMSGKKVYQQTVGQSEARINTSQLLTGSYILELRSGDKISHRKILIEAAK